MKRLLFLCAVGFALFIIARGGFERSPVASSPAPTPVATLPVEPALAIVVEVNVVKQVGGKFRYFYRFTNSDARGYTGKVVVTLHNGKMELGSDTLNGTMPHHWQTGYIDLRSSPDNVSHVQLVAGSTTVKGNVSKRIVE